MTKTIITLLLLTIGTFSASTASADPRVSIGFQFDSRQGLQVSVHDNRRHRTHSRRHLTDNHRHRTNPHRHRTSPYIHRTGCRTVYTRYGYETVCHRKARRNNRRDDRYVEPRRSSRSPQRSHRRGTNRHRNP